MAEPKISTYMEDGYYDYAQVKDVLLDHFDKESDLCDYIEENIEDFCQDLLGVEYKSHEREYSLPRGGRKRQRLDFLIRSTCGKLIVVECKNPTYDCEIVSALGQILGYKSVLKERGVSVDRIVLVSTRVDDVSLLVIKDNNLPIELIGMDKDKSITLSGFINKVN